MDLLVCLELFGRVNVYIQYLNSLFSMQCLVEMAFCCENLDTGPKAAVIKELLSEYMEVG